MLRHVLLVLHIVAAATWLGSNVFQMHAARRFATEGGAPAATWMRTTVAMGTTLYTPAGIVVLLTGVGLVLNSSVYGFDSSFVNVGFLVIIVSVVLGVRVFGPKGGAAAEAFAAGDDEGGRRSLATVLRFAYLDTALVILAVVAMVTRWDI